MMNKKTNANRLRIELEILENVCNGYINKQKTAQDVLTAVDAFKKNAWSLI
jgi:hypothetical protein